MKILKFLCVSLLGLSALPAFGQGQFSQSNGVVTVNLGGETLTQYHYKDVIRPFFHPLIGPNGVSVVRAWPVEEAAPGEAEDHVHHRGLWYAHGDVNGVDFWHDDKENSGKIEHVSFGAMRAEGNSVLFQSRNKWVGPDGKVQCTDTRDHRFEKQEDGTVIVDLTIAIHASEGDVVFQDTKEGSMAMRVAPTIRLEGEVAKGGILNSNGDEGKEAWGKRANWCDFFGPDGSGEMVHIAMFDHPSNPVHPTWWHARQYGLFAANPFGKSNFEGEKDKSEGNFTIKNGETSTWRYRVIIRAGEPDKAAIEEDYQAYSKQ